MGRAPATCDDDLAGESTYQPLMSEVLTLLERAGLVAESDCARVISVPGFTTREGAPLPLIVQARTGGFDNATSDLSFVKKRDTPSTAPPSPCEGAGRGVS